MRKLIFALMMVVLITAPASLLAVDDNDANDNPQAGLFLYEKNCGDPDWEINFDGAWGKVNYAGGGFVFNGHSLDPGEEYLLIEVMEEDDWPVTFNHLGVGTANRGGNVKIAGPTDIENLESGTKIWLILADDGYDGEMTGWNCESYLFEHNLL